MKTATYRHIILKASLELFLEFEKIQFCHPQWWYQKSCCGRHAAIFCEQVNTNAFIKKEIE